MKKNNEGFTLAEMLIVVAIIGVLIAIITASISNSIEKAREATDMANIRGACDLLVAAYYDDTGIKAAYLGDNLNGKIVGKVIKLKAQKYKFQPGEYVTAVPVTQKKNGWQSLTENLKIGTASVDASAIESKKYYYIGINKDGEIYKIVAHES